jgi:hypothetical protein
MAVEGRLRRRLDERMEVKNIVESKKRKCSIMRGYVEEEIGDEEEEEEIDADVFRI